MFDPDTRVVACAARGGQSIVRLRAGTKSAAELARFIASVIPLSTVSVVQSRVDGEDEARVSLPNESSLIDESKRAAEGLDTARTLWRTSNYLVLGGLILLAVKQVAIVYLVLRLDKAI